MARGRFITLEGGEGAGKSTQLALVGDVVRAAGYEVVATREPGGTPRAERIRELLLEKAAEPMPPSCELLLMFAARASHVENLIKPALERGAWVVCDRFTDASYAYQGAGRGMSLEPIRALETIVQAGLEPDLTLLLDTPVAVGLQRAQQRNSSQHGDADRFESEQAAFFERVRLGYLEIAKRAPQRVRLIDAARPIEQVSKDVRAVLQQFIAGVRQ
ncbi:MAG: dTMP kinase [Steroidobacteraceae bacterium]